MFLSSHSVIDGTIFSLLALYDLGGSPGLLKRAYEDEASYQRPIFIDEKDKGIFVTQENWAQHLGNQGQVYISKTRFTKTHYILMQRLRKLCHIFRELCEQEWHVQNFGAVSLGLGCKYGECVYACSSCQRRVCTSSLPCILNCSCLSYTGCTPLYKLV